MKTKAEIQMYFKDPEKQYILDTVFDSDIEYAVDYTKRIEDCDEAITACIETIEHESAAIDFLKWLREETIFSRVQDYLNASGEDAVFLKPFVSSLGDEKTLKIAYEILEVAVRTVKEQTDKKEDTTASKEIVKREKKIFDFLSTFRDIK